MITNIDHGQGTFCTYPNLDQVEHRTLFKTPLKQFSLRPPGNLHSVGRARPLDKVSVVLPVPGGKAWVRTLRGAGVAGVGLRVFVFGSDWFGLVRH